MNEQETNFFTALRPVANMRERYIRVILVYFFLLMFDILKPFSYALRVDFLFTGTLALFMNYHYFPGLVGAVVFAYIKDSLSINHSPWNLFAYPALFILIRYFLYRFTSTIAKIIIIVSTTTVYGIINGFGVIFLVHSLVIFFPINYTIKQWMKLSTAELI